MARTKTKKEELPKELQSDKKFGAKPSFEVNPDIIKKIEDALRIGTPIEIAVIVQGISPYTLRDWVYKAAQDPNSIYAALITRFNQAAAEMTVKDLAVIEAHALGRPAEYEMEVVRNPDGTVIYTYDSNGNQVPQTQVAKDGNGNPIIKRPAIKSDFRASEVRLKMRYPRIWARAQTMLMHADPDEILNLSNTKEETKGAMTFEQAVAEQIKKFEEEY